jgi:ActR/RegA family two-component response regulator
LSSALACSCSRWARPEARASILTGYGNIATAVNALKLGAVDYLAKPVDADDVAAALLALGTRPARGGLPAAGRGWMHGASNQSDHRPRSQ